MRFCVDAHVIGRHLTGNEVYVRNLLREFAAADRASEFVAYLSVKDAVSELPPGIQARFVSANPYVRLGFELARKVRQDAADLLHVQYTAPLGCRVPVIVSVHDVSYLEHPEYFTPFRAVQLQLTVRRTVRMAQRVLTLSEFSRRGIERAYGLDDSKVRVVPLAVSSDFRPLPRQEATAFVRSRFGIEAPFVLTVGDLQPRKNHIGLIGAFAALLREHPSLPHRLVIVGKDTWFAPKVKEAARQSAASSRIHFPGFVDDDDLLRFYAASDLFVFPSFYEGFGLPVLEAMACGRAVACSNTSALPEVADASAVLFDPTSRSQMVGAMRDMLLDSELRTRFERLGQANAARFSWRRTAEQTLRVYHEVAGQASRVPEQARSAAIRP